MRPKFALLGVLIGLLVCVPFYALLKTTDLSSQLQSTVTQSSQTRVHTVEQRCQLTQLILRVLVRVHDKVDAAPFQASYATCEKQLLTVKKIAREAP